MFARTASVFVLALPLLAAASVLPRNSQPAVNQCNSGSLQCCSSVQSASNAEGGLLAILGLLGVVLGDVTGLIGSTCSGGTFVGVSGTSCTNQAVCCTNNSFNGIVALGCTPINVNL